jgi:DNA polymerase-3 subunit delta
VYLFYGEEDFLIEEKINLLKEQFGKSSLNIEVLDGDKLNLETFSAALCTRSLLGDEKLVIVRDLEVSADDQEKVIALFKNVPAGVRVVLQASAIDKRTRFFKWLDEQGETEEFKTFAPWELSELISWIKERAQKRISDDAARLLQEICGNNLRVLDSELKKLLTYVGENAKIGEEDVLKLASPGEINAFALLDNLRGKRLDKALSVFQVLLRNKEDLFQLLGLLAAQYRLMLQIKSLPASDINPNLVAKKVGGSPFFVRKCMEGLDRFALKELKENLGLLLETNLKLKTGEQPAVVFELLLASLCRN